jgi:iron complex outermembrane recepter protein
VAGLSFAERGPGQSVIVLRGVNSTTTQFNTDEPESKATVALYLDESPVSLNGFNPDLRLFDINRIEVLRGPQGTLFGSGAMSGVIRYISNVPDLTRFDSKANVTLSKTRYGGNNWEYSGMLNIPLSDTAALRFAAFSRDIDGFIDNVVTSIDTRTADSAIGSTSDINSDNTDGVRLQLQLKPHDRFTTTAKAFYQYTETGGYPTQDTFDPINIVGNNPTDAFLGELEQSRLYREDSDDSFTLISLNMKWNLSGAELVSVSSYLERDLDSNWEASDILPFLDQFVDVFGSGGTLVDYSTDQRSILNNITETEDIIQELRLLSSGDSSIDWLVGLFYHQQEKFFSQSNPSSGVDLVFGPEGSNLFISEQIFDDSQLAMFGEVSLRFNNRWRLTLGARWYRFEQDMHFDSIGGLFTAGIDVDRELEENGLNPKGSLQWRPAEDILWYMTAAKGFRLGGTNDPFDEDFCGIETRASFESDSLWNYELGYKTNSSRIQFAGAVYFIDWKDVPVSNALTCGFAVTRNANRVESLGFESDVTLALTPRFELSGNISYIDAEFTSDFSSDNGTLVINEGTQTPLVPDLTFNISAVYHFPAAYFFPTKGVNGYIRGTYSYQGERYNSANNLSRIKMDAYGIVNLRGGVDIKKWKFFIFVDNLTDKRAVVFKDTIFLIHNRDTVNRPRTVGMSASWRY